MSYTVFVEPYFVTKYYSFIQINSDLNHLIVNPFICTVHVCVVAEVCLRL